jgi:PKD domain
VTPICHRPWPARRPPGGAFGAPEELFGGGSGVFFSTLSAGGDAQGNAFAAAGRFASGGTTRLNVAGFDPVPPRLDSFSVPGAVNNPISFSMSPFDVWGPVTTSWDFGDGSTAPGTQVTHAFPTPGQSYNVTVTASDAAGNSASASAVTVPNAPPGLDRLSMLRRVFAVARSRTAIEAATRPPKRGTAFRYRVSEPARVTIRIERVLSGRRVGSTCRRPTARLRKRPRCRRYVSAGRSLVRNVPAGRVTTKFSGRIGRRALRPGRYRATLVAADRLGLFSPTRTITFRVVSG